MVWNYANGWKECGIERVIPQTQRLGVGGRRFLVQPGLAETCFQTVKQTQTKVSLLLGNFEQISWFPSALVSACVASVRMYGFLYLRESGSCSALKQHWILKFVSTLEHTHSTHFSNIWEQDLLYLLLTDFKVPF